MSDARAAVLAANQAFYDAFRTGDMAAMRALWAEIAPVACAHPGAPLLVGRETVLESWESILGAPGRPEVFCFQPQAHLLDGVAYVTCYEWFGDVPGATLLATNILALEDEAWRFVHHHAGPTPVAPPSEAHDHILH